MDAARDVPGPGDYPAAPILGAAIERFAGIPDDTRLEFTPVQDQGATMRCTLFSAAHSASEENSLEMVLNGFDGASAKVVFGESLLADAVKLGFSEENGWHITGPLGVLKTQGVISGYAACRDFQEVWDSVLLGKAVATGSNSIDWQAAATTGRASRKSPSPGHAFCALGTGTDSDGRFLWMRNSYGPDWGIHGGWFKVYESDFPLLYTCYSVLDAGDAQALSVMKSKMIAALIETMVEFGITNGQDLPDGSVQWRSAVMTGRALALTHPAFKASFDARVAKLSLK